MSDSKLEAIKEKLASGKRIFVEDLSDDLKRLEEVIRCHSPEYTVKYSELENRLDTLNKRLSFIEREMGDLCASWGLVFNAESPKESIEQLLKLECQAFADPAVSKDAKKRQDQFRDAVIDECADELRECYQVALHEDNDPDDAESIAVLVDRLIQLKTE